MDIYGEREVLCFFTSCLVLLVVTDTGNLQKKMPLQCQVCWSPIVETGFALLRVIYLTLSLYLIPY